MARSYTEVWLDVMVTLRHMHQAAAHHDYDGFLNALERLSGFSTELAVVDSHSAGCEHPLCQGGPCMYQEVG